MRKKILGLAVFATALTLSTGITAFAGTWKSDSLGTFYENDDGSRPVYAGWFTDPADGSMYYMDPDGYMMSDTSVEGFRLGPDGRRVEKTEDDLRREAERKAELARRPSPAKQHAQAEMAAAAAKTNTASTATTRSAYQAEMEVFMEKIFTAARDKRTDATIKVSGTDDNTELTYGFANPDGYRFISCSIWKIARVGGVNYQEQAIDLSYHYDAVGEAERAIYDDAFNQLVVAAIGDTEGHAVLDAIRTEREAGNTNFDRNGNTDTGNSYTLKYRNNLVTIAVVCSEIVPQTEGEATEGEGEDVVETPEEAAPVVTTSVIVAGQGAAADDADTTTTEGEAGEAGEEGQTEGENTTTEGETTV